MARGGAHAEHVPGVLDAVALGRPGHERVNDLGRGRVAGVQAVQAEEGPHGREAAEELVPGEAVAAVDALGLRGRQEHGNVVAPLGVAGRVDFAVHRADEQPLERLVARPPQVGGHTRPVDVHVDAQRGGVRVVGQAALLLHHLGEGEAAAAELARHRAGEVAGLLQLGEVLGEESVLAVVARRPFRESLEHRVGKDARVSRCCHVVPPLRVRCGRSARWPYRQHLCRADRPRGMAVFRGLHRPGVQSQDGTIARCAGGKCLPYRERRPRKVR